MSASPILLCTKAFSNIPGSIRHVQQNGLSPIRHNVRYSKLSTPSKLQLGTLCNSGYRRRLDFTTRAGGNFLERDDKARKLTQALLWTTEGIYILWLFLLPYAPGDPVWAISPETVNQLIGLSLNFFFVLPLLNAAGIHLIEGPVLHPMSEGLFNFVIGWTFLFAPLLYTDRNRNKYNGSLDLLWGLQMFLTNTFLLPYMAIRLNKDSKPEYPISELGSIMTRGAPVVGFIGGAICLFSIFWGFFARADVIEFGMTISDKLEFLISYLSSERLAYAFIWDICLYTLFQPWLIGDNLQNIEQDKVSLVKYLRFVPVVGIVAYCLCLNRAEQEY